MADLLTLMELETYTDLALEDLAAGQQNFHFLFFVNASFWRYIKPIRVTWWKLHTSQWSVRALF